MAANRRLWDARVPVHLASAFYDVEGFEAGRWALGRLVVVDQHPVLWPWDDREGTTELRPRHPYFSGGEPVSFQEPGTYADESAAVGLPEHVWNHGLGEVVTAAAEAGLVVERLEEHPVVAWRALPFVARDDEGFWRLPSDPLPLSFSLRARRPHAVRP